MFEVGFTEIILIFGIALLVLGPARLPKLAADIGRWAGRARAMARQLRTQLEQETQFDPLADAKPATGSPSNTIHAPAPAAATPPQTSPENSPGAPPDLSPTAGATTADDASRAAPAQLATAVPAPLTTGAALDEPVSPRPTSAATASPANTDSDEPKAG